jgi:hypothetical protein
MGKNKKRNQSTLRAGDPSSKAVFIRAPYEEIWLQFIHTQCDYTATDGYRRARLLLTGYGWTMEASTNRRRVHSDKMTKTPRERH